MRRVWLAGSVAGVLALTTWGPVGAQDAADDARDGQRIEVPAAGIAVTYPPDWDVSVEMRYDHTRPGDPYTGQWWVTYGSSGDDSCSVHWYLYPGPSMMEMAAGSVGVLTDLLGGEPEEVELPIGVATRLVHPSVTGDDYTTTYEVDRDGMRWDLTCYSEELVADDWLGIAETLEWLPAEGRLERALEPPPEDAIDIEPGSYLLERVELPQVGIAMDLPPAWEVDVIAEERELALPPDHADDGPVAYLQVLSAEGASGDWCSLQVHPDNPLTTREHAELQAASWMADAPEGFHAVVEFTVVGAELADQVDLISDTNPGLARAHIWDSGSTRLVLTCGSDIVFNRSWLPMADSVELLDAEPAEAPETGRPDAEPVETPESEPLDTAPTDEPETTDPSETSLFERRVEFPEFGVALTIPSLWTFELRREESAYPLPDEFGEDATVPATEFLSAFPFTDGVCWVETYVQMPMDLERHAQEHGWAQYSSFSESLPETARVQLPAGEGYRVIYHSILGSSVAYAFDLDGSRYLVDCIVGSDGGFAARSLAASITAIGDEPPELWLEHLEFDDAGIALTLPLDWEVTSEMEFIDTINVAGPETTESDLWRVMHSLPDAETWCDLFKLSNIPLSLEDHGNVLATIAATSFDPPREAEVESVALPLGDAVRVTESFSEGAFKTVYLFDVGGVREYLMCSTPEQPDDDWLSVAETIEALDGAADTGGQADETVPPGVPAEASYWSELGPLESTIAVDDTAVMRASCEQALWIEYPDGTFSERVECTLTDDPVGADEVQGTVPDATVTLDGGACEWVSDFWLDFDGSQVWAESWAVTIEPDGSVLGTSWYGAEALECGE